MNKKLVILGVFYSGYKDLWADFVDLFRTYWPDCPYEFSIVSDTIDEKKFCGCDLLSVGEKAEFSTKIRKAIERIDSDYYLILLEDFFFSRKIQNKDIECLVKYIAKNNIKYYSMPMKDFSNNYKGRKISKYKREISPNAEYTISCQPAIWKKDFLRCCIGDCDYNAWVFEGIYCKSKLAHTRSFLEKCIVDLSNPLGILHGALQGKMIPKTFDFYKNAGYQFKSNRQLLSKAEYRKEVYKNFIRGIMPYWLQKRIKTIVKHNSVITSHEDDIKRVMSLMGLEEI